MHIKSIYLAKRNPEFTHDQFVARWRQHGALAMSKPFFYRNRLYSQAELIEPPPFAGADGEHDGVAYLMSEAVERTRSDALQLAEMVVDEYATFSGPIVPVILRVEETVLKKGPPGGVTAFLFFIEPAKAQPVAEHYRQDGAADRVILNTCRDELTTGEVSSAIPYRAVVEVSAPTLEALTAVLDNGEGAAWRKADLAAITRECVMWDRMS